MDTFNILVAAKQIKLFSTFSATDALRQTLS
jgi:hypothetical protein